MRKLGRSIFLLCLALAGGANAVSAQSPAIRVQVYDYARLDPGALRQFISYLEELWDRTGLPGQVSLCRGALELSCEGQPPTPEPLVVRLLPGDAKVANNARRPPLGQSLLGTEGGGYASVYVDAVKSESAAANVSWVMVLAHATSHELGHLLLGTQAHTPNGLMKANWDRPDYQAIAQNRCHFTQQQIRQLSRRYGTSLNLRAQKGR